jgi:hypothetical protein
MCKRILPVLFLFLFFTGFHPDDKDKRVLKTNTNDDYKFISVNNILMWVSNNGDGSHDPFTDGNGFYWPGGLRAEKSAIFEDGLIFGARVGSEIRVNGNTFRQGLQAGKIINGLPDDPDLEKYRIYKIVKDISSLSLEEQAARQKDYMEWPIKDGAPYIDINNDGQPTPGVDKPQIIGDETLWFVSNDMDSVRSKHTYGMPPMGLEIQTTVYGFKKSNSLGDAVFKKYRIINKGSNVLNEMHFGIWSDPDLGDANDDFAGCDTMLDLSYVYNADNMDGTVLGPTYGANPPAVGFTLLQGPIVPASFNDSAMFNNNWRNGFRNLDMTSFAFLDKHTFRDPQQGTSAGSTEYYNYLRGLVWDGSPYINPNNSQPTIFPLSGDPVNKTGWYDGQEGRPGMPLSPGDRRILLSAGPITLSPGDTQEVVFAIHIARGSSNINSIKMLKDQSKVLKSLYNGVIQSAETPEAPAARGVSQENSVTLWWENNSEDYEKIDPFLQDTLHLLINGIVNSVKVTDKTYSFEGYRVWQYEDKSGRNPRLLTTIDIQNYIKTIYRFPYEFINPVALEQPLFTSPDEGIKRYITITKDSYTDTPLLNGSGYYFGVTAYGYSKFSDPPVIESAPEIIEVIPGRRSIDSEVMYPSFSKINFQQTSGFGDGVVTATIIDPAYLKGHTYEVSFESNWYNLVDKTTGDTLIKHGTDFAGPDSLNKNIGKNIVDGFILNVRNLAWEHGASSSQSKVRDVIELNGPGGVKIDPPVQVFSRWYETNLNSTGAWTINAVTAENNSISRDIQDLGLQILRNR